ncbi:hypothetical protein DRH13_03315 [Candidatus Woesebacteria bacterium]|nr:MAG: hypothetical protein DRH13_03315 [Candidatus Woesebacteria bacterium]
MKWIIEMMFAVINQGRAVSIEESIILKKRIGVSIAAPILLVATVFGLQTYLLGIEACFGWFITSGSLGLSAFFAFLMFRTEPDYGVNIVFHVVSMIFLFLFVGYPIFQAALFLEKILGG